MTLRSQMQSGQAVKVNLMVRSVLVTFQKGN